MTMSRSRYLSVGILLAFLLAVPLTTHAQLLPDCDPLPSATNACSVGDLLGLIVNVYNFLIGAAALVAVLFLIWGGARMLYWGFLEDSASELAAAKLTARRSLGGFIIVLLAYLLVNTTIGLLGGGGINGILNQVLNLTTAVAPGGAASAPSGLAAIPGVDPNDPSNIRAFGTLDGNGDGEIAPLEPGDEVPLIAQGLAAANSGSGDDNYDDQFDLNGNNVVDPPDIDSLVSVYLGSQAAAANNAVASPPGTNSPLSTTQPPRAPVPTDESGGQLPLSWRTLLFGTVEAAQHENVVPPVAPWQNPQNPLDVNDDGSVTPIDALQIINDIHANGARTLAPAPYYDTDGNGRIANNDATLITEYLNRLAAGVASDERPIGTSPFWQNQSEPFDTSGDGVIVPLDALLVINELNRNGSRVLLTPPPYLDVDGNNVVNGFDIQRVADAINDVGAANGDDGSDAANVGFGAASPSAFAILDTNADGELRLDEVQPTFDELVQTSGARQTDATYVAAYDLDRNGVVEAADIIGFADTYVINHRRSGLGGSAATLPDPNPVAPTAGETVILPDDAHQLFVTSGAYPGDVRRQLVQDDRYVPTPSGIEAAHQACNLAAADAGLQDSHTDANWFALLSTPNYPVNNLLDGPVYSVTNQLIAQTPDDLWSGHADTSTSRLVSELGIPVHGNPRVWTGTSINGEAHDTQHCAYWTSGNAQTPGVHGTLTSDGIRWYSDGFQACTLPAHLYCVNGVSRASGNIIGGPTEENDVQVDAVQVVGLTSGVTDVDASAAHTCAVHNGAAKCFGENEYGQLGNDSFAASSLPVQVQGLGSGVTKVATGSGHSCALVNGGVQCWGRNGFRQLGNTSTTVSASKTPVPVEGLSSGVTDIVAGSAHSCAVHNGVVKCWGGHMSGQLGSSQSFGTRGNGSDNVSATPLTVEGMPAAVGGGGLEITSLSAGMEHTCVTTRSPERTLCWGGELHRDNISGIRRWTQASSKNTATEVGAALGRYMVAAGWWETSHIGGDAFSRTTIKGFGRQWPIPVSTATRATVLVPLSNTGTPWPTVIDAAGGRDHACVATTTGQAYCWPTDIRGNMFGQVGEVHPSDTYVDPGGTAHVERTPQIVSTWKPVQVPNLSAVSKVAAGGNHSCAIAGGSLKCWGGNLRGQLGNGRVLAPPPAAPGLPQVPPSSGLQEIPDELRQRPSWLATSPVQDISVGRDLTCAKTNTTLKCWIPQTNQTPALNFTHAEDDLLSRYALPRTLLEIGRGGSDVTDYQLTDSNGCYIQLGKVNCWGDNRFGQIGRTIDPELDYFRPINFGFDVNTVLGVPDGATKVVTGATSCAIANSQLYCWGDNSFGQLGDGSKTTRSEVRAVSGMTSVTDVANGPFATCAVNNGGLYCWGWITPGFNTPSTGEQVLQQGTTTPTLIPGFESGVTKVGQSWGNVCAVQNGSLKCWGDNKLGQLGVVGAGTADAVTLPGLESGVTDFHVGPTSCAIKSGAALCWGQADKGVLGDGVTDRVPESVPGLNNPITFRATPQLVEGLDSGVTALSYGWGMGCAVQNTELKCWGRNRVSRRRTDDQSIYSFGRLGVGVWNGDKAHYNIEFSAVPLPTWL
ncbi:hypothetical protein CL628_04020 [bacterium]|nr:hypothetical protein [bacterium]